MTPDANDLCVFAIRRGDVENKEIYCNPLYPYYLALIEKYRKSPFANGVMNDYIMVNPKTDTSMLSDDSSVSFVPMSNVQEKNNTVTFDQVPYGLVKKGFTVFQRGDMLWAKITPCMQNGKSCITDKMPTDIGFGSTEFHVIRKRSNNVYMPFVWSIFANENVLLAAQATFSGTAGQQRVSASFIEQFPAVIPNYETQIHLVNELEAKLEAKKEKERQAVQLINSMSEYIHAALGIKEESSEKPIIFSIKGAGVKGTRFDPEFHNPLYTVRVKDIQSLKNDELGNIVEFSTESWNQRDFFTSIFPYIEIANVHIKENHYEVTNTLVEEAPSRAKNVVRNGDIIVSLTRPHRGAIATVRCQSNELLIASTGFAVLRKMKRNDVLRDYLQWILLDDYILMQMLQRSSGGNYPAITSDELKKIIVPIPDIETQKLICQEAERRQVEAEYLRKEAEKEWQAAKREFEQELLGE